MIYSNLFNVFKKKAVTIMENVRSSFQRSSMFGASMFGSKLGEAKLKDPVSEAVTATSGFQSLQDAPDKLDVEENLNSKFEDLVESSELEDDDKDDDNQIRDGNGEDEEDDEDD